MKRVVICLFITVLVAFLASCHLAQVIAPAEKESLTAVEDSLKKQCGNDWVQLLQKYDSVLQTAPLSGDGKYWLHKYKFNVYYAHYLNDKALLSADSMLYITEHTSITSQADKRFLALNHKAEILFRMARYSDAFAVFEKARSIADTISNTGIKARYFYSLGMAYYKGENFNRSASMFKTALFYTDSVAAKSVGSQQMTMQANTVARAWLVQELLDNIGLSLLHAKRDDSALIYFNSAKAFIEACTQQFQGGPYNWNQARSVVDGNIANIFENKELYDSAIAYCMDAIALAKPIGGEKKDLAYNEIKLARLYVKTQRYAKAEAIFNEFKEDGDVAAAINSEEDSVEINLRMTEAKALYYNGVMRFDSAFRYLKLHHALQEKSWDLKDELLVTALDNGLGTALKQNEIENLKKDNKIALLNKTVALLATLTFCLVLAGVVIVLQRKNRNMSLSLNKNRSDFEKIAWTHSHILRGPLVTAKGIATVFAEDSELDDATRAVLTEGLLAKLNELDDVIVDIVKGAK